MEKRKMELYQLETFVNIAQTGNMTQSAKNMNISLSALSTQLKNLENSLDTVLFVRGPKGMTLTEPGKALLVSAKKVLDVAQDMRAKAAKVENRIAGPVNIGINTHPGFLEISELSRLMSEKFSNVNIRYIETQTFETVEMLTSKKIDLGFHYGILDPLKIFSAHLGDITICITIPAKFCPEHLSSDFQTIAKLPWVWTRYECPFHTALKEKLDENHLEINQVTDAVEENIVWELVRSGAGLGLMRKDEALELQQQGVACPWDGFELEIPLGLACLGNRKSEPVIQSILGLVQKEIKFVKLS